MNQTNTHTSLEAEYASVVPYQRSSAEKHKEALNECDRLITHFTNHAKQHERKFNHLKQVSVTFTLLVTVLSALAAGKKLGEWEWAVPVVSGLAALSTTVLSQTNAQKIWIRSCTTQQKLSLEKFLYLQDAGNYSQFSEEEKTRYFSNRVTEIWSEGHDSWGRTITEQKS